MKLAAAVGINVAGVQLQEVDGKDVLLVERFDRMPVEGGVARRHFFSALTALGLSELQARDASYADFADFLAKWSADPRADCHELYRRMILNMVIGNTDDHARNHAVFWDGSRCRLTPAYDVCVLKRVGEIGTQAMLIGADGNYANFNNALSVCKRFLLDEDEAQRIHDQVCEVVAQHWKAIAHDAGLEKRWIDALEGKAILSPRLAGPRVAD